MAVMSIGVQCFNANGNLIFDNGFATSYQLGASHTAAADGYLIDERLVGKKGWVIITDHYYSAEGDINIFGSWTVPIFTFANNRLSWEYAQCSEYESSKIYDVKFIYGVYAG